MNLDKYTLKVEEESTIFRFESVGPNGRIPKIVQFELIDENGYYNLALGDFNPVTGKIDDLSVSNNRDTDKILATVVAALFRFLDRYPEAVVYAEGSSDARTRLYQMGITRFYEQACANVHLFGQLNGRFVPFVPDERYSAFLVKRK
ncbi:hypothetical protein MUK70_18050 [Dyadobacter chenwenxiniae]|uniref:Uncharacterized protein n=1 Tax=Dyadobacter chenwenxiniae TaxID=2906456 RepID=A0A9X1PJ77_9BACT|nr:hypothetical protein [Dyadobacter chenwenxiniae]MCF0061144.1 hypothetical protein [Dyadobacter chenwenxiniae]UON80971.1 hypothetical protein MUK70_18050 [Dyadobacter chenwenxiniae]